MVEIKVPMIPGKKPSIVGKIDVKVGNNVSKGDVLAQVETAKGNREIKALVDGIIEKILVSEGDEVVSNEVIFLIRDYSNAENISNETRENIIEEKEVEKTDKEIVKSDLLIIGAGPGGYVAAIYAAKRGLKVTIVEKNELGGTCLNIGCIPTKSMVESAHHLDAIKEMDIFGIDLDKNVHIDMEKVLNRKENVVDILVSGVKYLINKNNINLMMGEASFIDDKKVKVNNKIIEAKNIIIATGSVPNELKVEGHELDGVIDSTNALNLKEVPKSLIVIGGGVIGLEFAFIYNSFGSRVHIIEYQDNLLPMLDRDCGNEMEKISLERGISIDTSSKVISIKQTVEKTYIVNFEKDGKIYSTVAEKVLMATGRVANIKGLGLENTNIKINSSTNSIIVDEFRRTSIENIYAIGDVSSRLKLAHLASHEAILAVDHILKEERNLSDTDIPSVVYTHPEVAVVGYSEEDLKSKNIDYKKSIFEFTANGKALTMNQNRGFIKILGNSKGEILGSSIVGPDASNLISSITIAMKNNITIEKLTHIVFPHPTTSEVIHEACLNFIGRGVHM